MVVEIRHHLVQKKQEWIVSACKLIWFDVHRKKHINFDICYLILKEWIKSHISYKQIYSTRRLEHHYAIILRLNFTQNAQVGSKNGGFMIKWNTRLAVSGTGLRISCVAACFSIYSDNNLFHISHWEAIRALSSSTLCLQFHPPPPIKCQHSPSYLVHRFSFLFGRKFM